MNVMNFSQNFTEIAVNLTGVDQYGVRPIACIQTNEVLYHYQMVELAFYLIVFLLFIDVVVTLLQWRDNQKKRLDSHDSD